MLPTANFIIHIFIRFGEKVAALLESMVSYPDAMAAGWVRPQLFHAAVTVNN